MRGECRRWSDPQQGGEGAWHQVVNKSVGLVEGIARSRLGGGEEGGRVAELEGGADADDRGEAMGEAEPATLDETSDGGSDSSGEGGWC